MMDSPAVVYLNGGATAAKPGTLAGLLRRLGSGRLARVLHKPPSVTEDDPYLLVLLASQAFEEDREQQAASLIDAAYAVFDQRTNVTGFRQVSHGSGFVPRETADILSTF